MDLFSQPKIDIFDNARFNGYTYVKEFDQERLTGQMKSIFELMKDGKFRTLDEIHKVTNAPHASISAQLRHLRKPRFGSNILNKQIRGIRENGLYEYQLILNEKLV